MEQTRRIEETLTAREDGQQRNLATVRPDRRSRRAAEEAVRFLREMSSQSQGLTNTGGNENGTQNGSINLELEDLNRTVQDQNPNNLSNLHPSGNHSENGGQKGPIHSTTRWRGLIWMKT